VFRRVAGLASRCAQVTVPDAQAFRASLEGRCTASVARALSAVKSLLTFGQQVGYLTFNAGVPVRLPKIEATLATTIRYHSREGKRLGRAFHIS